MAAGDAAHPGFTRARHNRSYDPDKDAPRVLRQWELAVGRDLEGLERERLLNDDLVEQLARMPDQLLRDAAHGARRSNPVGELLPSEWLRAAMKRGWKAQRRIFLRAERANRRAYE